MISTMKKLNSPIKALTFEGLYSYAQYWALITELRRFSNSDGINSLSSPLNSQFYEDHYEARKWRQRRVRI